MSTLVTISGNDMLFTKGAAEIVSGLCTHYYRADGTTAPIDDEMRRKLDQVILCLSCVRL